MICDFARNGDYSDFPDEFIREFITASQPSDTERGVWDQLVCFSRENPKKLTSQKFPYGPLSEEELRRMFSEEWEKHGRKNDSDPHLSLFQKGNSETTQQVEG